MGQYRSQIRYGTRQTDSCGKLRRPLRQRDPLRRRERRGVSAPDRGYGTCDQYTCRTKITVGRSLRARSWKMGTNWSQALFPSLKRRGGCAIKKISRSNLSSRRRGGAKRKPDRAQPQEKIGEIFRPEEFRRTDHPVCGASEASRLLCVRTETVCQFIHTF